VDGAGFGFAAPLTQAWRPGSQARQVHAHIQVVAVAAVSRTGRVLVGARLGTAYTDERVVWRSWYQEAGDHWLKEGCLVVGDALYGMDMQGLAWIDEQGGKAVMRVQESLQ